MYSDILKILNEELLELKNMSRLAQQRLDLHREEFNKTQRQLDEQSKILSIQSKSLEKFYESLEKNDLALAQHSTILEKHGETLNQHKAGFEVLLRNMERMEQRLDLEIKKLKGQ